MESATADGEARQVPVVPALQLPVGSVTWSNDLVGQTPRTARTDEHDLAKKSAFKARQSVSMYVDDTSTSESVIDTLRSTARSSRTARASLVDSGKPGMPEGSGAGSRPSSVRAAIRGDRVGMATKAALQPSQLESHITNLMRASFGRLKKSYLAVGPDAVLTSRKPSDFAATQPIAPTPRRKSYMDPASPRKARGASSNASDALPALVLKKQSAATSAITSGNAPARGVAASPRALPGMPLGPSGAVPIGDAGKKPGSPGAAVRASASPRATSAGAQGNPATAPAGSVPVPKKKHVAIAAEVADKDCGDEGLMADATDGAETDRASHTSVGWGTVRREVAAGAQLGSAPSLGWTGNISNSRSPTPKMDFMDVAFQMIGTAKKGAAWQPLAVTETYMGLDPQAFNSEVRRRALEWRSAQEADFRAKALITLKERVHAETQAYLSRMGIMDTSNPVMKNLKDKAHKTAQQRILRADAFTLEHKRVNDWDLSDAMATFANQYRQELREERIDQELKRLKAVQEAAQCRAEAQASRRLIEHQKSVAREHAAITAALGLKAGESKAVHLSPQPSIMNELQMVEDRIAGKLEKALGAANTPLLRPGSGRRAQSPAAGSGSPRPSSAAGGRTSPKPKPSKRNSLKHVAMMVAAEAASAEPHNPRHAEPCAAPQLDPSFETELQQDESDTAAPANSGGDTAVQAAESAAESTTEAVPQPKPSGPDTAAPSVVSFSSLVKTTMKQSNMPAMTLSGHKSVGRGFAKWIGRAVGTTGLKHKTEIEDLPAYKLRELGINTQPRVVYMHNCEQLKCWPATAVVSQLHLAHVDLSHVIMDTKSCEALGATLPAMPHLRQLSLSHTQLTDVALATLLTALKDSDLSVLDVSYNQLSKAGCEALSAALAKPQAIRCVGPTCTREGAAGRTPKGFHITLQELNLSGNAIGDDGLAVLEASMCNTKALSSIILARTELTDQCASILERLVEFVPKLQHLDVSWNHLGPSAATALAKGLNPGGHLVSLDVSWNGLEDGLAPLAAAIQKGGGAPLKSLNLAGTRPTDEGLLQLALMFKNSSKLGLAELRLGDNRIGGVAGQCFLRSLQAYAATAAAGMFVDTKNCSTGTLEPQLLQAEEEKKKKPKSGKKGSKKKKGEKEGKEKDKGESKGKAKGTGEAGDEAEAPVAQAVGRHFLLQLNSEADRAVACLLAEHELQAQGLGRSAWYNATIDGKVLAQNGKWLIPLDLQQWPKALPSRGVLELDVLQLPMNKAPWIRADQIYIHSRKDSEVLALQQLQSEGAESNVVQAPGRPTSSQYQMGSAGHLTAGVETMEQVSSAEVNSSASVAIQPDLT